MKKIMAYTSEQKGTKVYLEESSTESILSDDLSKLLDFLLEEYEDTIKICWNLDEFVAPLLRLASRETCEKLAGSEHRAFKEHSSLFYIPNKVFSFRRGRYKTTLYGIEQYFPEEKTPEDSISVAAWGDILIKNLAKMGLEPTKLTSPVAIYEQCALSHMDIPTISDMPEKFLEAQQYAYKCCGRLWISAYQIGHWGEGECFDYDIVSAFPYEAANLYSTRYCQFTKSDKYIDDAQWGFLRGKVTIEAPVSPIVYRTDDGSLINPVGTWEDYLTLDEVRFIEKWGIGKFELYDGWFLKFTAPVKPFEVPLTRLFNMRRSHWLVDRLAKRMAVGVYGKTIEEHDDGKYGKFFNPIYGAQISTRTRLRVGEWLFQNKLQDNLIHVGVDGCLLDKRIAIPDKKGMGVWRLAGVDAAFVISPGQVFSFEKQPKGITYGKLLELIEAHPRQSYYEVLLPRTVTLAEALTGEFSALGKVKDYHSHIDLNLLDPDRHFPQLPRTGEQLLNKRYKSEPIRVSPESQKEGG